MRTIYFFTTLFFLGTLSAIAQQQDSAKKVSKWKIGVEIGTIEPITETGYNILFTQFESMGVYSHERNNSGSFGITGSYLTKSGCGFRLSTKYGLYKSSRTFDNREFSAGSIPYDPYTIDTFSVKQPSLIFSPGMFWNFSFKKINLIGGFQMIGQVYSPAKERHIHRYYDLQTNTLLDYRTYDYKLTGGYSIGLAPFVGFSVNIFKHISLGAEFSSTYAYYHTGGQFSYTETRIYPGWLEQGYVDTHTYNAFKFSRLNTSIALSYNF